MLKYEKDVLNFLDSKPDVYIILGDVRRLKLKNKNYPDHQGQWLSFDYLFQIFTNNSALQRDRWFIGDKHNNLAPNAQQIIAYNREFTFFNELLSVTLFAGSALILSGRITENWEIRIPSGLSGMSDF